MKIESYEEEKSKFLSILDKLYELLRPRNMIEVQFEMGMNYVKKRTVEEMDHRRGYTNIEDSVVSMVIRKCVQPQTDARSKKEKK